MRQANGLPLAAWHGQPEATTSRLVGVLIVAWPHRGRRQRSPMRSCALHRPFLTPVRRARLEPRLEHGTASL
eukprot:5525425-Prymnesium_polylepis.2